MSLEPGIERSDPFTAQDRLLTDVRGSLPVKVLSTPGMIAMMERCASILASENLPDGKATVGFEVCVKHVAAAPEGAERFAHVSLGITPNPTLGPCCLRYSLAHGERVQIALFDPAGRRIRALLDAHCPPGLHRIAWDGRTAGGEMAGPGAYLCRIRAGTWQTTHKLLVVR